MGKVKVYGTDDEGWAITITKRQLAILQMSADGESPKNIRQKLEISPRTMKRDSQLICQKLGAQDRVHAVALALRADLIQ